MVQEELVKLGEQMVTSSEGTRAVALELCREFEDRFLLHIAGGEVSFISLVPYMDTPNMLSLSCWVLKKTWCWEEKSTSGMCNENRKRHPF
jgi:hypothetical protein